MSRTLAVLLLVPLLHAAAAGPVRAQHTAPPPGVPVLAGVARFEAAAAAPGPILTVPPAGSTAAPVPVRLRRSRGSALALGILGGASAGAAIGCVIGDCDGELLPPPDDVMVGGLLGAVIGLVVALWVEPEDDWRPPRLPPRPR